MSFHRQLIRKVLGVVLPKRLFLLRASALSDSIYLTLDDGPHAEHTPRVLDALAHAGAKGTFFVIGREAEQHPEIVRRMVAEGHSVGDHTWSHSDIRTLSSAALADELRRSSELLEDLTGQRTRLFRPPHGKLGVRDFWALLRRRYTIALWNIDPKDYACRSAEEVQEKLDSWRCKAGDIVLLHDNHAHTPASVAWIIGRARAAMPQLTFKAL